MQFHFLECFNYPVMFRFQLVRVYKLRVQRSVLSSQVGEYLNAHLRRDDLNGFNSLRAEATDVRIPITFPFIMEGSGP